MHNIRVVYFCTNETLKINYNENTKKYIRKFWNKIPIIKG